MLPVLALIAATMENPAKIMAAPKAIRTMTIPLPEGSRFHLAKDMIARIDAQNMVAIETITIRIFLLATAPIAPIENKTRLSIR
ncbi:MAG TPA: hypothetical protein PKU96_06465 [bacterium]|jgi:hypothetical protein|nr:hypothetical protein [bacterium]HQC51378.1 hypothetical protein [bacterium]HQG13729.1 hypothetical protein [bacterium]HQH79922.1 hypothetical protein [bacterium]